MKIYAVFMEGMECNEGDFQEAFISENDAINYRDFYMQTSLYKPRILSSGKIQPSPYRLVIKEIDVKDEFRAK